MNPNTQFPNIPGQDNNNPPRPVSDFSPAQPRPALDANDPDISEPAYRPQNTPSGAPIIDPVAPAPQSVTTSPFARQPAQALPQPNQQAPTTPSQSQSNPQQMMRQPLQPQQAQQPTAIPSLSPHQTMGNQNFIASVGEGPLTRPPLTPSQPSASANIPASPLPTAPASPVQSPPASESQSAQAQRPGVPEQQPTPSGRPFPERPLPPLHDEPDPPTPRINPLSRLGTFFGGTAKTLIGMVVFLGIVFGGAALLNAFVFQSYYVDGQSMAPALQNNDRLIISKVGRTSALISNSSYIPERGDIVVLDETSTKFTAAQSEQLIKRVIGLPGERIRIENGEVTVINDQNPNGFNPDETLGLQVDPTFINQPIELTIPDDSIYVLGDNRSEGGSFDSRAFGPVTTDHIIGTLWVRVLPFDQVKVF